MFQLPVIDLLCLVFMFSADGGSTSGGLLPVCIFLPSLFQTLGSAPSA